MNTFFERLGEGDNIVLEVIVAGALFVAAAVLAPYLARRRRVWVGANAGRTCLSPYVLFAGLLSAFATAAFLALGLVYPDKWQEPGAFIAWLGLVAFCSLGSLLILVFTRHTWEWDEAGLRWRGVWRSDSMRWPDIVRLGKSSDGQFFAEDRTGTRISWSTVTLNHEALRNAIQRARPNLTLPA